MNVQEAYDLWATQYDSNENKTRDLEGISLRNTLSTVQAERCLEIGCGTGKNTEWLVTKADNVHALDLSHEMLSIAKDKIKSEKVTFLQADILQDWTFVEGQFDLATFSLVLEHVEDLNSIFSKLAYVMRSKGIVYVSELHPFRQYQGKKARFETSDGLKVVTCYTHNISDFTTAANQNGFRLVFVDEYFDDDDRTTVPRILTLLFERE